MKKGQIAEGNVTTVEFPNKGIVMTDEGERVIVKNTIPGQRVSFAVNKVRKGKAEGRLLETVKKSPRETADTCRHFGQCGGCTYHVPSHKNREWRYLLPARMANRLGYRIL